MGGDVSYVEIRFRIVLKTINITTIIATWFPTARAATAPQLSVTALMSDPRDLYYVAVKLFLVHDGKLFIFKDKFGDWDLPGGRIQNHEFDTPLPEVLKRKMTEEVGESVEYELGKPVVFFRHERPEASKQGEMVRIFGVGYEGKFAAGEVALSELHTQSEWVDIATFQPEKYFTGGWLKGVQEYLEIKKNSVI